MIEQTLTALLADANVPASTTQRVVQRVLEWWTEVTPDDHDWTMDFARLCIFKEFERVKLSGPIVTGLPRTVRVARIIHAGWALEPHAIKIADLKNQWNAPFLKEILRYERRRHNLAVSWVSLADEISRASLNEIHAGLGLTHFESGSPLLQISYSIDSSYLHVPTIFDARLWADFVSKPKGDFDLPRAWNWQNGEWGMPEMVHTSDFIPEDIEVRFLGTVLNDSRPGYSGLAAFRIPQAPVLESLVTQILRQATAHRDLEPFLSGAINILTINANEFEHFLALLYARQGYRTTVTKASRDGGYDVVAIHNLRHNEVLLIQAKQTRGTVGIRVVRELLGARFLADELLKQSMLVVATTGRFSQVAKDAEQQFPAHLQLLDYDKLQHTLRAINNIGLSDITWNAVTAYRRSRLD